MSIDIKIYIISLQKALDRKHLMEKQLRNLGIDYEFVDAYDASKITDNTHALINSQKEYEQN